MNTLESLRIWDGHCHLEGFEGATPEERMQNMLRYADRMGIHWKIQVRELSSGASGEMSFNVK